MQKVNFLMYDCQPDLFVKRYKRRLKNWTIDEVHDLWLRACDRGAKRYQEKAKYNDKIVKEVPANERGEHIVYFTHRNDPKNICYYNFRYHQDWKGYGVSQNRVELKSRDEKLTFLLAKDQKLFDMGQEYHRLDYMCSNLQYRVREVLWRMVETELQKKFKNEKHIPDVFILKIGTKKYYVELDSQHRFGYLRFHLKNEHIDGEYIAFDGTPQPEKVAKNPLNFSEVI